MPSQTHTRDPTNRTTIDHTVTITTVNLRGSALSSTLPDNKLRQLVARKSGHWHDNSIILVQEVKAGPNPSSFDPTVFGGTWHAADGGDLGILMGKNWSLMQKRPQRAAGTPVRYEETILQHSTYGKWGIINVHLPSPTHAHAEECAHIREGLIPRVRALIQRVDALIVGGDFNEVLDSAETDGQFHPPLFLPHILELGLIDISPANRTFFRSDGFSSRLDRVLAVLPLSVMTIAGEATFLVDSDHKAVTNTIRFHPTSCKSIPIEDVRRDPARWTCNGQHDRKAGIICLSGYIPDSSPSSCPLNHECKFEIDTRRCGKSQAAVSKEAAEANVSILSGPERALQSIDWETVHTLDDGIRAICRQLSQCVVRRTMTQRSSWLHECNDLIEDLSRAIVTAKRHPERWLQMQHNAFGTLNGSGISFQKRARRILRRIVRRLRRAKIQLALRERRGQLDSDLSTWFKRIKRKSVAIRTDACWEGDTLVFTPSVVRLHFAQQVQAAGTQIAPPASHPYARFIRRLKPTLQAQMDQDFTGEEIESTMERMRRNSAPGPSGITARILQLIPVSVIQRLCNRALTTSQVGRRTSKAYVRLLNKTSEPFPPPGKFRPITLLETGYKLLSGLIQQRILGALKSSNCLPANTYAFGPRTDITAPIILRAALLDHARCTGSPLIILDFDASAAFNAPPHEVILEAWKQLGIPTKLLNLMRTMLTTVTFQVITDAGLSPSRPVLRGAVQGDVMAPLHWLMTYAALQHMWQVKLSAAGIQSHGTEAKIRIAVYADDTAAYLRDPSHLTWLANMIATSLKEIGVQVNPSKTVIQVINAPSPVGTVTIMGQEVKTTSNSLVRYLGVHRNPLNLRDTVCQAEQQISTLRSQYRLGALDVREAFKLVQAVLVPKLTFLLAFTPVGVNDLLAIQQKAHALIRTAKGFPVGVLEAVSAEFLPSLLAPILSRRLEGIKRHLMPNAQEEIRTPLLQALTSSLPRSLQSEHTLWLLLRHPGLAAAVVTTETLLWVMTEALQCLGLWLGAPHSAEPTLSDLLTGPASIEMKDEVAEILSNPEMLAADWWTSDGLTLQPQRHQAFPLISKNISKQASRGRILRLPTALKAYAREFVVQSYPARNWTAYYYYVVGTTRTHYRVHYLHESAPDTGHKVVTTRLPPDVSPWLEHEGEDPRGPVGLVEHHSVRPIVMEEHNDGWRPCLLPEELQQAYEPNRVHGYADSDAPEVHTCEEEGPNILYTDGSGHHEGVGWGVSGRIGNKRIRMCGGWVDPSHTAQEGELVAMLHALALASRHQDETKIFSDSQHIVHTLTSRKVGRFAPWLMKHAMQLRSAGNVSINHIRAHQRSEDTGPSNQDADLLAKQGAQKAYAPLTLFQLPDTMDNGDPLVFHNARTHGIVTHPLTRWPGFRKARRTNWIHFKSRETLARKLRVYATIRGHVPGMDQNKCRFCGSSDPALSHHMECGRRPASLRNALYKQWGTMIRNTGMPPGFWRLSPQPPWPSLTFIPSPWREYQALDGNTWCVSDGPAKHEFLPPAEDSTWATKDALAAIISLQPESEPLDVLLKTTYPCLIPSPALSHMLGSSVMETTSFSILPPPKVRMSELNLVHTSWHWAFRKLLRCENRVTLHELGESIIGRIAVSSRSPDVLFLCRPALREPPWSIAVDMGSEETTILGDLGEHSEIYPVSVDDIMSMRDILSTQTRTTSNRLPLS